MIWVILNRESWSGYAKKRILRLVKFMVKVQYAILQLEKMKGVTRLVQFTVKQTGVSY